MDNTAFWRSEWQPLLLIVSGFLACFYLPGVPAGLGSFAQRLLGVTVSGALVRRGACPALPDTGVLHRRCHRRSSVRGR